MKITFSGRVSKGVDGRYVACITVGEGASTKRIKLSLDENYQHESDEPRPLLGRQEFPVDGPWVYRGDVVHVKGGNELSPDEVRLRIKHAVLRRNKAFARMRREIEALENVDRVDVARRERIPDSVRLFVWQRDSGKCVRCGNAEKLEFDHIIPVVKGGSNTERNIQLLCESCNRSKGAEI